MSPTNPLVGGRKFLESLQSSTTLEITVGSATLVLPALEITKMGGMSIAASPTIGFPAFWYYDFLFHIGGPKFKGSVGGTLSVFSRD